jgi:hypothetical protein
MINCNSTTVRRKEKKYKIFSVVNLEKHLSWVIGEQADQMVGFLLNIKTEIMRLRGVINNKFCG